MVAIGDFNGEQLPSDLFLFNQAVPVNFTGNWRMQTGKKYVSGLIINSGAGILSIMAHGETVIVPSGYTLRFKNVEVEDASIGVSAALTLATVIVRCSVTGGPTEVEVYPTGSGTNDMALTNDILAGGGAPSPTNNLLSIIGAMHTQLAGGFPAGLTAAGNLKVAVEEFLAGANVVPTCIVASLTTADTEQQATTSVVVASRFIILSNQSTDIITVGFGTTTAAVLSIALPAGTSKTIYLLPLDPIPLADIYFNAPTAGDKLGITAV